VYSAESIIAELKANDTIICEGIDKIGCPSPSPETHKGVCLGDPDNCEKCDNNGCEQRISIHQNLKKLRVITLRFSVSPRNRKGFVRKKDSALQQLIDKGFINKDNLKSVSPD